MSTIDTCLLCNNKQGVTFYGLGALNDVYRIICPRCGEYRISEECYTQRKSQEDDYLLSGLVRELNEQKVFPEFLTTNIDKLKNTYPVPKTNDIEGKSKKFLERVKRRTQFFGQKTEFEYKNDYPLAYSKNLDEFKALLTLLKEKNLISHNLTYAEDKNRQTVFLAEVSLLADGWILANSIESKNDDSVYGFVAAWFDDSMDENIDAIEDAISESGYMPICIRDKYFPEKIMDKALGEIRRSRFVVVDLTGSRNSVFFEAGFAFGLGIETIYVYKASPDGTGLPPEFYVRHYQCYKYKDALDLKTIIKDAISARLEKKQSSI